MDTITIRGGSGSQDSFYAEWYPRVVALGHRLVARHGLDWAFKSSDFLLLLRNGCYAADAALSAIRLEDPAAWRQMTPRARVNIAVRTAARAMAVHLQARKAQA